MTSVDGRTTGTWRWVVRLRSGGKGGEERAERGAARSLRSGSLLGAVLRGVLHFCILCALSSPCRAAGDGEYHTPLAGEPGRVTLMGRRVEIQAVDRARMNSITLGASLLEPPQGQTSALPVAAFIHRRVTERSHARAMIALFVNEIEYDRDAGGLDLVAQFENETLPVAEREINHGEDVRGTSLYFGTLVGAAGIGYRTPVSPFQVDNDFRVQLLARAGYFYAHREGDTSPGLWVPPDTALLGARLRCRFDGLRRNLLELPHKGLAAGFDLDFTHRDRWRGEEGGSGNHNYAQFRGHLVGAYGVPGISSDRDRILFALYGGITGAGRGDRFNAFRINGSPFPSEQYDLACPHYGGVVFDQVLARGYATATAGYRRELTFFLYLSALGSYIWADRSRAEAVDRVVFRDRQGAAATVALDSAFLWNSSLYLAWSYESGVMRDGRSGSGFTLMWNKLL